jgi:8-oxo-dGTP diphosphatase
MLLDQTIIADPHVKRTSPRKAVQVAVGVIILQTGEFLLTSRPSGKAYAGYWEFPGGKYELGESGSQALARELAEELGIKIDLSAVEPWRVQCIDYPHALVELHFFKVKRFEGTLRAMEGQSFAWSQLPVRLSPVLPGTVPVLGWLAAERGFSGVTH